MGVFRESCTSSYVAVLSSWPPGCHDVSRPSPSCPSALVFCLTTETNSKATEQWLNFLKLWGKNKSFFTLNCFSWLCLIVISRNLARDMIVFLRLLPAIWTFWLLKPRYPLKFKWKMGFPDLFTHIISWILDRIYQKHIMCVLNSQF